MTLPASEEAVGNDGEAPPQVVTSPLNVSVLAFAAEEQKVKWGRIKKGSEYRNEKIMKGVAIKKAKSEALQKAISGSADRAFAMRSRAEEVKEVIIADIRNNPDEPHMWSQITREVAFGGEGAINRLLPVDINSIQAEFAKIKEAELEAAAGVSKKKKNTPVEIKESPAEALHGYRLHLGNGKDNEEDDDEEEESDDDEMDKVPTMSASMPTLALVSNDTFKKFTQKAVGEDADRMADQERRRKKQGERRGKLFPNDGDIVDAETGRVKKVNYTSWIHPKDAPDEFKTTKVLGALGKFKGSLKNFRVHSSEKTLRGGEGGETVGGESMQQPASHSLGQAALHSSEGKKRQQQQAPVQAAPQQPVSEVDWEAQAAMILDSAISEDAESMVNARESTRRRVEDKTGKKVIMAIKCEPQGSRGHTPDVNAKVAKIEAERRLGRAEQALRGHIDAADRLLKATAGVAGENSVLSEFEYYDPNQRKETTTPVVDIGAADKLSDLFKWANTDTKRGIAELSVLKNKKNEELMDMVREEEDRERERMRAEQEATHPAILERARVRNRRDRELRQKTIKRIREENELIIAGKMASLGLIR